MPTIPATARAEAADARPRGAPPAFPPMTTPPSSGLIIPNDPAMCALAATVFVLGTATTAVGVEAAFANPLVGSMVTGGGLFLMGVSGTSVLDACPPQRPKRVPNDPATEGPGWSP